MFTFCLLTVGLTWFIMNAKAEMVPLTLFRSQVCDLTAFF